MLLIPLSVEDLEHCSIAGGKTQLGLSMAVRAASTNAFAHFLTHKAQIAKLVCRCLTSVAALLPGHSPEFGIATEDNGAGSAEGALSALPSS